MKEAEDKLVMGRRKALKIFGISSAALMAGSLFDTTSARAGKRVNPARSLSAEDKSSVALATGADRREMMFEVLEPFRQQILEGSKGKQLVLKPNMVTTNAPLCATHVDALRGVLEFIEPLYSGQVVIAESSARPDSTQGFRNYGYYDLQEDFDLKFIDLNQAGSLPLWVMNPDLHPAEIRVADMFLDPDNYIISISRLKTHDTTVMTAGIKNMVMAAPLNMPENGEQPAFRSKRVMHSGGPRWLNFNMFLLAQQVRAELTVIDGVEGMQGNGPVRGQPVEHGIALAGEDPVAVDSLCTRLMGLNVEDVGYLNYCAAGGLGNMDPEKIDIIGGKDPGKYIIPYIPPDTLERQLQWKGPLNLEA